MSPLTLPLSFHPQITTSFFQNKCLTKPQPKSGRLSPFLRRYGMNSTSDSGGFLGSQHISGFGYGIGVSVGILLLITTITLTSYFCTRAHPLPSVSISRRNNHRQLPDDPRCVVVEMGIDEASLLSYPKFLYSEAKNQHLKDSTAACCSICLADYKGRDMLRLLPDCGHMFHLRCVDPWLRLNPTCPVCRTSPVPTPLSTPLAEMVPLASRQGG